MEKDFFINNIICPKCKKELDIEPTSLVCSCGLIFEIEKEIYDLTFPKQLLDSDSLTRKQYDNASENYDQGVADVFKTLNSNEKETRNKMIGLLEIKPNQNILEIGCGTGRDSEIIINKMGGKGNLILNDVSKNMLKKAQEKFKDEKNIKINYFLGNASYLPFKTGSFDCAYHFGGINTFSELKKALNEITRVVKIGGRVVIGDESVATWLREDPTYKTLMKASPAFKEEIPLKELPPNAEEVRLQWIFGNAFYIIDYKVGEKNSEVNINMEIQGRQKKWTWKSRAEETNSK